MMRKFYGFNSESVVRGHISQVRTLSDLLQLEYDIKASGTNLTCFRVGVDGVWAVDCCAEKPFRHVFFTKAAFDWFGGINETEGDSYSVLEEGGDRHD